jgi:hypothetical protein
LEIAVFVLVGDIEPDEEIADDGSHSTLLEADAFVLAVIVRFKVVVVDLLGMVVETLPEETGEIGIILQHGLTSILANTQ